MKRYFPLLLLVSGLLTATAADIIQSGYPITPVPFTSVSVGAGFWGDRLADSRDVTIPLAFSKCEESGRYDNFIRAAAPSSEYHATGFPFDDTDVYKTIEGASYCLAISPDPRLEAYIDSVLLIVAAAQEPDGYLFTARTQNPANPHDWAKGERWEQVEHLSHEFYNLGHMIDGAVAHYQATGKRNFLDIAIRYADCVCRNIGEGSGKLRLIPGHQIAEMALVRLYTVTGDRKYLDQARFFLEARGTTPHRNPYLQSHIPVLDQDEAVGHAVRATYMYAGMADVAAITGDSAYITAIDRIWDDIVSKKLYITGGIGARHEGEAFGENYELPNSEAYCETCAAIGNVYVNCRLFLLHGHARYFDVLERTLYNGLISGVSLDGGRFFYPNPLASAGDYSRKEWFGCACCPSNISRFIPSLPGYIYAVRDNDLFVNLFMSNRADIRLSDRNLTLSQTTAYPHDGRVTLTVEKEGGPFALRLRIPGWVFGQTVPSDLYTYADALSPQWSVKVNGREVAPNMRDGYMVIDREWIQGDRVELDFEMPVRIVKAHPAVEADRGLVAIERGPLVYCAEWPDNPSLPDLAEVSIPADPAFSVAIRKDLLGGVETISLVTTDDRNLTLIPYYAWAHRGEGPMAVWLPTPDQSR